MTTKGKGRRVVLTTMGNCSVRVDGRAVNGVPSSFYKMAVYLLLSSTSGIVSRQSLRSVLWSDIEESGHAGGALRQSLARIKRIQESMGFDLIASSHSSIYLVPHPEVDWDLENFLDCMDRIKDGERCPYPGDLLADLPYSGGEFEDWLADMRQRLKTNLVDRLTAAMDDSANRDDTRVRYDHARDLAIVDPSNEDACRMLMIEAARQRNFGRLQTLYRDCQRHLLKDLGVGPSEETTALYSGLMRMNADEDENFTPGHRR